jgi:peptide/nickel transport system permease protein
MIPLVLVVTFASYGLVLLLPGDPAVALAGEYATAERVAQIRTSLGLDRPFVQQYGDWLGRAVTGDLGKSLIRGDSVRDRIAYSLPITLQIVGAAVTLALVLGGSIGILAATRPGSAADALLTSSTTLVVATPNFWLAMILILFFAVDLGWLPALGYTSLGESGAEYLRHMALPVLALAMHGSAEIAQQLRAALLEVFQSDYNRFARANGIPGWRVVRDHALKNAAIPVLTVLGLLISRFVGGTVVLEKVFQVPGAGALVADAAATRDLPVLQGIILLLTIAVLLTSLAVDLTYRAVDPRISFE